MTEEKLNNLPFVKGPFRLLTSGIDYEVNHATPGKGGLTTLKLTIKKPIKSWNTEFEADGVVKILDVLHVKLSKPEFIRSAGSKRQVDPDLRVNYIALRPYVHFTDEELKSIYGMGNFLGLSIFIAVFTG